MENNFIVKITKKNTASFLNEKILLQNNDAAHKARTTGKNFNLIFNQFSEP